MPGSAATNLASSAAIRMSAPATKADMPPAQTPWTAATIGASIRWSRATPLCSAVVQRLMRSEEHTSELQSLMRISYAVFCLKKKNKQSPNTEVSDNEGTDSIKAT